MKPKKIILVALLSAMAFIALWAKVLVPGPLVFRLDLSLAVVLFATLKLGTSYGLCIELILWFTSLLLGSGTMGVGPTFDFLIGAGAVGALALAQRFAPGKASFLVCAPALFCGIYSLCLNFLAKPFYALLLGPEFVQQFFKVAVLTAGGFSFLKVLLCGLLAWLVFKHFSASEYEDFFKVKK